MNSKPHMWCSVLVAGLLAAPVSAQEASVAQAQRLLEAGQAFAALRVLEAAPQTRDTIEWRARAHLVRADQTQTDERCRNLRQALSLSSAASAGQLVEFTHKAMLGDGCPAR